MTTSCCPPSIPSECYDCPLIFSPSSPSNVPPGQLWYNTGTSTINGLPMKHIGYWDGVSWTDLTPVPKPIFVSTPLSGNGLANNPVALDCASLVSSCQLLTKDTLVAGANIQLVENNDGTITVNNTASNVVSLSVTGSAPNKKLTLVANSKTVDLSFADICQALKDSGCALDGTCIAPVLGSLSSSTATNGSTYSGTISISNATNVIITAAPAGWTITNTANNTYTVSGTMPNNTVTFTIASTNACSTGSSTSSSGSYTITLV